MIAAAAVGTMLEWYDFSVYAALATWIAAAFFPADTPGVSLLSALAVFGVGFLFRPLGAVAFGHIGDRIGRKEALALTIIVMGVSTALLAVAPTHATAGILGPVVLVVARCGQGFSGGGEFAGGASFLIEHAPEGRRGFYGAIHYMALIGGNLVGAGIVAGLSFSLTQAQMETWGWRVPFVIGAVAAFAGLYIRRRLGDTPVMEGAKKQDDIPRSPFIEALRSDGRAVLRGMGLVVGFTIMSYTYVNMQSYIVTVSDLSQGTAVALYSLSLLVQLGMIGLFGRLSDRVGRKPVLVAGAALMVVVTYPSFLLISSGFHRPDPRRADAHGGGDRRLRRRLHHRHHRADVQAHPLHGSGGQLRLRGGHLRRHRRLRGRLAATGDGLRHRARPVRRRGGGHHPRHRAHHP